MQWRYEAATKTIRSVPENYWIATLDSWDGAVDHQASARLIAAAPALMAALQDLEEAAAHRENTMGDPCRLMECKANLEKAARNARTIIAEIKAA